MKIWKMIFFPLQMGYFQVNHGIVQGVAAAALSFDVLRMHWFEDKPMIYMFHLLLK